jgi:hypothetical protein
MIIRPPASGARPKTSKSFLVLFFKKEQKGFFLKKEAKTFIRWRRPENPECDCPRAFEGQLREER